MGSDRAGIRVVGLFCILALLLLEGCGPKKVFVHRRETRPGVYHVVKRHQTLYRICKTYGVNLQKVAALNRISDPGQIEVGQRIFIPGARRVLDVEIVIDDVVAEAAGDEKATVERRNFLWPVEGRLTNRFEDGEGKRHQGIDLASPAGTPIRAADGGKVIYSGNTIRGYGNLIILRHPGDYVTVYAHNQTNLVEEGVWVGRGQVIGRVGDTGRASGPHLHFEIRKSNRPVDPLLYLK